MGWTSNRTVAVLAVLGLAFALDGEEPAQAQAAERPNVVVFVLDTLRSDTFAPAGKLPGRYGEVVAAGTVFTRAQSTGGWTIPSIASMWTGQYPNHHGVTMAKVPGRHKAVEDGKQVLPLPLLRDAAVLPERFQAAGYTTFGTSSNALMNEDQGFHRGFDHYRRFSMKEGELHGTGKVVNAEGWSLEDRGKAPADADLLLDYVNSWGDKLEASEAWFLWVHLMDNHMPYRQRAPWYENGPTDDDSRWSAYRSSFAWQSQHVAAALEWLPENTIVVFISDHGELMGEKGLYGHPGEAGLPAVLLDVPLVISGPGVKAGTVDTPVTLADLAPTLAELCGLEPFAGVDGISLVPALQGKPLPKRALYAHRGQLNKLENDHWSVVDWPWKLYRKRDVVELYDLSKDPGERKPVQNAEVQARLEKQLDAHLASTVEPLREQTEADFDEETMKGLEALGYIE